jgi:outer membrane protein OmpA-like peptidoglycan-associated protein
MADALYSPYLQGYKILIVGHTDGKGSREHNLKLSQQRADAIRDALINPLGVSPSRIEAVVEQQQARCRVKSPRPADQYRQVIGLSCRKTKRRPKGAVHKTGFDQLSCPGTD